MWPKSLVRLRVLLILSFIFLIGGRVLAMVSPLALKGIIDSLDKNPYVFPAVMCLTLIGSRVLQQGMNEMRDYLFNIVSQRVHRDVGVAVFRHLQSLSLSFHLNRQTGGLSRVIERGTLAMESIGRFLTMTILPSIIEVSFLAIILWLKFSPLCSIIMMSTILAYVLFTIKLAAWRLKIVKEINTFENEAQTKAVDSLLNFETVKYFNSEEIEINRYSDIQKKYEIKARVLRGSLGLMNFGQGVIYSIGLLLMMTVTIKDVNQGILTSGDIAALFAFSLQLLMPLFNIGFAYRETKQGLLNINDMLNLLNEDSDIKDQENAPLLKITEGKISFKKVSFTYDNQRNILKDLSFDINPGQRIAFVGTTGAGKSTISRLLFRFYDPSDGQILVDNQDIKTVQQRSLRQAIGMVPQDTVLFNDTLLYNITYGAKNVSASDLEEVLERTKLKGFINTLPLGLATKVGERGLKLSGGEKQRVAIARMLLKKPKIFVFDEATSALDNHTEKMVHQNISEISKGYTTLLIAHRLSTVVDADCIFVLNDGKIAEQGTHGELLINKGIYASLWQEQLKEGLII